MHTIKQTALAIILSVLLVTSILTPVSASFSDSVETRSDVPYVDPPDEEDNSSEERQPNENRGNGNGPPDDSDDRNGPPDDSDDGNGPPESNGGNGPTEDDEGNGPPDESDQGNDPSDESSGENGLADGSSEGNGPPEDTRSNGPPANDDDGNNADPPSNDNDSNSSNGAQNQNNSVSDENRTVVPTNGSALALRISAYQALDEADFPGNGDRGGRLISELNSTFEYHLDDSRINSAAVFRSDSRIAAGSNAHAPNVSSYLVDSDREIASTSISDTEHVVETLQERNVSFNESAVEYHLEQAHSAYEQGERLRDRSSPGAVQHYRQAWTHSQRALDYLDEAVEPNVTITHRTDLPHNESINYSVEGTVFDVRSDELTTTLTVENETRTLDLQRDTRPGTVARFNTTVELDRQMPGSANRTYTITVSAEDPGVDIADQGYDETDQVDIHDPQSGADQLRLDGDGLPDTYEEQVTETDPLDPDSNSSRTAQNESANGIIDGIEDFDDDRLNTYIEYTERLDPLDPDTDDDNLTDGLEYQYQQIDPADSDTDDDGVPDGREDPDDDGLVNEDDEEAMTGLFLNDSDRDGLEDGPEVHRYGTDPTEPDTDNDGLTDYEEVELGTDPLVADSDSDGTADGNETYQSTTSHSETGVSVDYQGQGLASERVQIESAPEYQNNPARASSRVRIENDSDFTSATLSIQINSSVAQSDYDELAIYAWNGSGDDVWQPIRGEIDEENGTITTTVSSFGYYTVLNQTDWEEHTTADPAPSIDLESNTSVECTGECSVDGSTLTLGSSDTQEVNSLSGSNQVTSISGSSLGGSSGGIGILCAIGPDGSCDEDNDGVNNENDHCPNEYGEGENGCPGGGDSGDDDDGSDGDGSEDDDSNDDSGSNDGDDSDGDSGPEPNVAEFTVNVEEVSDDVDVSATVDLRVNYFVRRGDSENVEVTVIPPGGTRSPGVRTIPITQQSGTASRDIAHLAGENVTVRIEAPETHIVAASYNLVYDSDGDGISDRLEQNRWYMRTTGNEFSTDDFDPDTDGDGLTDGEEVTLEESVHPDDIYTEEEVANPERPNTDGVGLNDAEEVAEGTNPLYVERISITAQIPTLGNIEDGEIQPEQRVGGMNGDSDYWTIPTEQAEHYNSGDSVPEWLEDYTIEDNTDYYRLEGTLIVSVSNYVEDNYEDYEDEIPYQYDVSLGSSAVVDINLPNSGAVDPGSHEMEIILRKDPDAYENMVSENLIRVGSLDVEVRDGGSGMFRNGFTTQYADEETSAGLIFSSDPRYGVSFTPEQSYNEELGAGAEDLQQFGAAASLITAGGTAATFYIVSGSARLAVVMFAAEYSDVTVGGDRVIREAYSSGTSVFMDADQYEHAEEGDNVFMSSGTQIIVTY